MKTASVAERADARSTSSATMKAVVFHGPGRRSWEDKPRPRIQEPTDAIVEVTTTTICGTDLHILKGDVPEVRDGRILGHEAVGIVREAGGGVFSFRPGDRVLMSCIELLRVAVQCLGTGSEGEIPRASFFKLDEFASDIFG